MGIVVERSDIRFGFICEKKTKVLILPIIPIHTSTILSVNVKN